MHTIDTRDLIEQREELLSIEPDDITLEEREQIEEISEIESACEDFHHGATLILERDFEEYAQEFAEDIGAIDSEASWPLGCIDWKQAASELATDYSLVNYQGNTYYVR